MRWPLGARELIFEDAVARYSWSTVRYTATISGECKYVVFVRSIDSRAMVVLVIRWRYKNDN